jgi:hypothetical protein
VVKSSPALITRKTRRVYPRRRGVLDGTGTGKRTGTGAGVVNAPINSSSKSLMRRPNSTPCLPLFVLIPLPLGMAPHDSSHDKQPPDQMIAHRPTIGQSARLQDFKRGPSQSQDYQAIMTLLAISAPPPPDLMPLPPDRSPAAPPPAPQSAPPATATPHTPLGSPQTAPGAPPCPQSTR